MTSTLPLARVRKAHHTPRRLPGSYLLYNPNFGGKFQRAGQALMQERILPL